MEKTVGEMQAEFVESLERLDATLRRFSDSYAEAVFGVQRELSKVIEMAKKV